MHIIFFSYTKIYQFRANLIANQPSIIIMGAGWSAEEFGLESPQGRYQLTKYTDSQNMRITPGLYYKGPEANFLERTDYFTVYSSLGWAFIQYE